MLTDFTSKNIQKNICEICDFKCSKSGDFKRHVLTSKHINLTKSNTILHQITSNHNCLYCDKKYKSRVGLWNHKKKCTKKNENELNNNITSDLILNIMHQNQEFKDLLLEQNKLIIEISKNNKLNNSNNNNSNNNSNNKTFNLQVFLNETCKDAMNIMDFVDSIKISLSDIESIGELGFVNGMSKLIIKNLNALDENMRPVHCNDLKRESLFVKDANVWVKEDANNNKLKKAIKYIAHKNICALPEWREKYPDCEYSESKKSDQYNHIVIEAMGGAGDNDDEKADKIISKIAKTITIDKNN